MELEHYQCKGCKHPNADCGSCPHNIKRKAEWKQKEKEVSVKAFRGVIAY